MLKIVHNLIKNHYHRSGKPYKGVFQLRYGPTLIIKHAYNQNPIEIDLKGVHNIKTYWGEHTRDLLWKEYIQQSTGGSRTQSRRIR